MVGVPVLSTGIAYHLPIKGRVSHPPSSNFKVSHRQPLEFDSIEACRGVHDHSERERRGRRRTKFLTFREQPTRARVQTTSQTIDCCALISAFFSTTTSTIRRKNVERNAQQVTFLEDQKPASGRCGPRRYAVI